MIVRKLFLIALCQVVFSQLIQAQGEAQLAGGGDSGPQFFGASLGALPKVKLGIERGDGRFQPAFDTLLRDAKVALATQPPTVTDKKRHPVTGILNDYYTQAPYLWPDLAKADGLPYLPKDGVINPESRNPDFVDYSRGQLIGELVETLGLAFYLTDDERYAAHASECLRVWFNDAKTRMNPHLNYAQAVPGRNMGRYIGIIEAGGVVKAVDAAGLLNGSDHWSAGDRAALDDWISDFLDWLLHSEYGVEEVLMRQNHGTMYDVRVVRLALSLGKTELARETLESVKWNRIARQIEPDGSQPMELRRTKSFNYSEMNLAGLIELASLGERVGVDLWSFETQDGRSIRRALEFVRPYVEKTQEAWPPPVWPYTQIVPFKPEIFAPAFRMAANGYQDGEYEAIASQFRSLTDSRYQLLRPEKSSM